MPFSTDTAVTSHQASKQTMPAPGFAVLRPGAVFPQMGTGAIAVHIRAALLLAARQVKTAEEHSSLHGTVPATPLVPRSAEGFAIISTDKYQSRAQTGKLLEP